jgi:hypothetical protein
MQVFEMPADSFKMFDFGFAYNREEFSDRTLKLVVKASGKSSKPLIKDAPCPSDLSCVAWHPKLGLHGLLYYKLSRHSALPEHVACS